MIFHPDVLAAHAEFGGDLESMQKLYEYPELKAEVERLRAEQRSPSPAQNKDALEIGASISRRYHAASTVPLDLARLIADAIAADRSVRGSALTAGQGVEVHPLEWDPYRAETPFGYYLVNDQRDVPASELKGRLPFLLTGTRLDNSRHETLEAAKAAAQADYERRIRSALATPAPSKESE